jgi:hypothetical protein
LVVLVDDQVAIGIADGLAYAAVRADVTNNRARLAHGLFALEE